MASPRDPKDRPTPREQPAVVDDEVGDLGAFPDEENEFADTPTTAVTDEAALEPEGPAGPNGGDNPAGSSSDFVAAETEFTEGPASGAYEDVVASMALDPFTAEPPPEEAPASLAEPLPEMAPEIWQAGVRALINVPDDVEPAWPTQEYWTALARLYLDEMGVADTAGKQVELTMAGARVAELLGEPDAAIQLFDDALTLAPDALEALRGWARIAESMGNYEAAQSAWARLGEVAASDDERAFYAALTAEWTLALQGDLDEAGLEAIPDGLARLLAAAEVALLRGAPAEVAGALEQAGFAAGGALGGALLDAAARFHEVAGDAAAAAEQRFVAARMDPAAAPVPLGRLRDAARQDARAAEETLSELLPVFAPSALGTAVVRWMAALARRRGDLARADELLRAGVGADGSREPPASVTRDLIDLSVAAGTPLDGVALAQARSALGASPAVAALTLLEASRLARAGDAAGALAAIARGVAETPDAVPLGILAEEIVLATDDPALQVQGIDLWLGVDPGRRAEAALALAAALEAQGGDPTESDLAVRAALQTAMEAAPSGAVFWTAAAHDVRAGRPADAAALLSYGADLWRASPLGPALAERAAELAGATPEHRPPPEADEAGRAGAAFRHALRAGVADQGEDRRRAIDQALADVPPHPGALALLFTDRAVAPERVTRALWAAGASPDAGLLRPTAVMWASLSGDDTRALALAEALHGEDPASRPLRDLLVRVAARSSDTEAGARAIAALEPDPSDAGLTLAIGEARAAQGDGPRATEALGNIASSKGLHADARRALVRVGALGPDEGLRLPGTPHPGDRDAEAAAGALARMEGAVAAGRWDDAIGVLETEPPHELSASSATLYTSGLLAEGRGAEARAPLLFVAAMMTTATTTATTPTRKTSASSPLGAVVRAAEADVGAGARAAAMEAIAARLGPGDGADSASDPRTIASLLCRAAAERAAEDDGAAAVRLLEQATAADPTHLPAAVGVRRAAARRDDLPATVEACAHEGAVLAGTEARVGMFLLAAELAAASGPDGRRRAVDLLRQALDSAPADETAFERLRALLEELGDHAELAVALSARIAAARNPFEITALRLARADLLAGPLGDRAGAKAELLAVLQKEPHHPRALARLGDLQYDDGAFAEAGELYLSRALVERSPTELRELFLRLGRIYTRHVPDTKRAAGAYERVVQIEPDNHEALAALSDLLIATGDTKGALNATERLTEIEPDPVRRTAALVRAGQLWERTGDLRHAGARFRRATDEAPRDAAAVTELARFLERTRDPAGRRALLDHSVGLLRHDVERGRFDLGTLRALVPLLNARGKGLAAAAAAQLVGALSTEAADREAAAGWAAPPPRGRRLALLGTPEVDERSFPPALPTGVRHVLRLVGPLLRRGAPDLRRPGFEVERTDRVGRGQAPRDTVDGVAAEMGVRDIEVYVRAATGPAPVRVEPGTPPAFIIGAPILDLGPRAVRFAAARALRLVGTNLDLMLGEGPVEAGALIGGVVRQFIPEHHHPEVQDELIEAEAARIAKLLPRKLKQEVMPFALESAGAFDLTAAHAAVRDGANDAGLLACGDLPAALAVVLATAGATLVRGGQQGQQEGQQEGQQVGQAQVGIDAIVAKPEALALLRFALSDDYDQMARAMED